MGTPSVAISGGPVVVRVWCVCGRRALERAEKQLDLTTYTDTCDSIAAVATGVHHLELRRGL